MVILHPRIATRVFGVFSSERRRPEPQDRSSDSLRPSFFEARASSSTVVAVVVVVVVVELQQPA
jgi:hypothetical protein